MLRRLLILVLCVVMFPCCHRSKNGSLVPNVPLLVAASVLGGGRILVDPLAARFLLGAVLLNNTLAVGTLGGNLRFRFALPAGYETSENDVVLAPGEQRAVQVYTTLVTASLLAVTVFATYELLLQEQAFPVSWQNEAAASNALLMMTVLASGNPVTARWFTSMFLARILVATLHSSNSVPSRVPLLLTEIRAFGAIALFLTLAQMQLLFQNADGVPAFPDGQGTDGFTVAASPLQPLADGDQCMFWLSTSAEIPVADPTRRYQFAFVMDADAIPGNNYLPSASFPNDFFAGTDRWYELTYAPVTGWRLQCKTARAGSPITVVPSAARAILRGDTWLLFVPRNEFAVNNPPFRATSFSHNGDFGLNPPNDWSGDPTPAVAEGLQSWQG